jgi:hypothetical protein
MPVGRSTYFSTVMRLDGPLGCRFPPWNTSSRSLVATTAVVDEGLGWGGSERDQRMCGRHQPMAVTRCPISLAATCGPHRAGSRRRCLSAEGSRCRHIPRRLRGRSVVDWRLRLPSQRVGRRVRRQAGLIRCRDLGGSSSRAASYCPPRCCGGLERVPGAGHVNQRSATVSSRPEAPTTQNPRETDPTVATLRPRANRRPAAPGGR